MLRKLGLQICASVMLAAWTLGVAAWFFMASPSKILIGIAVALGIAGLIGIVLIAVYWPGPREEP